MKQETKRRPVKANQVVKNAVAEYEAMPAWTYAVALGLGVASFLVNRRLFRLPKIAALAQACVMATSSLNSMKPQSCEPSLHESYKGRKKIDASLTNHRVKPMEP